MIIARPVYLFAMGMLSLVLIKIPLAQDNQPVVNIDEIGKQIESSLVYKRARKIAREIEGDLNQRVQKIVIEKRGPINALNQQILEQTVGPKPIEKKDQKILFDEKSRIFIFVSRSVPLETLKNYAAAIDTLGDDNIRMVFRAFPKNFLDSMLRKSPECTTNDCVVKAKITIGSKLFKRYTIHQVPAVVYDPDPTNQTRADWMKVSGAAPLEKILTMFHRETGEEALQIAARRVARK